MPLHAYAMHSRAGGREAGACHITRLTLEFWVCLGETMPRGSAARRRRGRFDRLGWRGGRQTDRYDTVDEYPGRKGQARFI